MNVVPFTKPVAISSSERDGWMQTLMGGRFTPANPKIEDLNIQDIAGALSKQCRYAGHCYRFYSVAEHCVHVARHAPDHLKLTALMHDASEAYLVDVPRPLKPFLPGYYEMEHKLQEMISQRYGLIFPIPEEIKRLDVAILRDERRRLMADRPEPPEEWGDIYDGLGVKLECWSPDVAFGHFMRIFLEHALNP